MLKDSDINRFYKDVDRLGLKFPVAAISEATGFSKGTVSVYLNKKDEPSKNFLAAFYKKFEKELENVSGETRVEEPESEFESRKSRYVKLRMTLKNKTHLVPVSNGKAAAGTVTFYNDEPNLIMEFIDAPFLGNVEGVVEVVGDSMYPTFKNGSRIAIVKLPDHKLLYWGECYFIIDRNWQGVVKRVQEGDQEDHIFLCSDNPDKTKYPPVKRKWSDIQSVFKVKADITKH